MRARLTNELNAFIYAKVETPTNGSRTSKTGLSVLASGRSLNIK